MDSLTEALLVDKVVQELEWFISRRGLEFTRSSGRSLLHLELTKRDSMLALDPATKATAACATFQGPRKGLRPHRRTEVLGSLRISDYGEADRNGRGADCGTAW